MRQTARRPLVFLANFDEACLRHQLYSLALTHFGDIRRSYTQQLRQQASTNRVDELWSPLFALAGLVETGVKLTV